MTLLPKLARRSRFVSVAALISLFLLIATWQLLPQLSLERAVRTVLLSIPLFLPLAGILRGRRYTYRWATLCVLPYFIVGLTEVVADPASRMFAAAILALALIWFVALVAFLRVTHDEPRDIDADKAVESAIQTGD